MQVCASDDGGASFHLAGVPQPGLNDAVCSTAPSSLQHDVLRPDRGPPPRAHGSKGAPGASVRFAAAATATVHAASNAALANPSRLADGSAVPPLPSSGSGPALFMDYPSATFPGPSRGLWNSGRALAQALVLPKPVTHLALPLVSKSRQATWWANVTVFDVARLGSAGSPTHPNLRSLRSCARPVFCKKPLHLGGCLGVLVAVVGLDAFGFLAPCGHSLFAWLLRWGCGPCFSSGFLVASAALTPSSSVGASWTVVSVSLNGSKSPLPAGTYLVVLTSEDASCRWGCGC